MAKGGLTVGEGSTNIAVALRRSIVGGTYAFGERLPSERSLAAHFGASRGTIREALRQLEETNLLARRMGSGTFVTYQPDVDQRDITEATSPLQLIDVRFALEPALARLAVINASARDIEAMADALAQVEAAGDSKAFSRADEAFHLRLAMCTQNPLMVWLYRTVNEIRHHAQWDQMRAKVVTPKRMAQYNTQHRALFEAILSRDSEPAVAAITAHLELARSDLIGAGRE